MPLKRAKQNSVKEYRQLLANIDTAFAKLQPQVISPAEGYIPYDYLIPAGYYKQLWDWDGFFIGLHLANEGQPNYLKWWVLNFTKAVNDSGYVAGSITPKGPRQVFGRFAMKPFLCQGAFFASKYLHDFQWIDPEYDKLKKVLTYREQTQKDYQYKLFYWSNAGESGVDNSVVLSNEPDEKGAIIAVDMNTWQLREYLAMARIAQKLNHSTDATLYREKADTIRSAMREHLWFPEDQSFYNIWRKDGKAIKRNSFQNFIPLIQHLVPRNEGRAMVKRWLWNKDEMLTGYGLRSLSRQDSAYSNENMIVPYSNWRGPIWIIAQYLYSEVLRNYGFDKQVRYLAYMTNTLVLKDIREYGSMHENYNADTGASLAPTAEQSGGEFKGFVGWDLLAQDMLQGAITEHWIPFRIAENQP